MSKNDAVALLMLSLTLLLWGIVVLSWLRSTANRERAWQEDVLDHRTRRERRIRKVLAAWEADTYSDQPSTSTGNGARRSRNRFHGLF
jgi:hypothetical protein